MNFVYSLSDTFLLVVLSFECLRVLQSTGYRPERGYLKVLLTPYFLALVLTETAAVLMYCYGLPEYSVTALYFAVACPCTFIKRKCPLKFTKRILRLLVAETAVLFVLCFFVGNAFFAACLPVIALWAWAVCLPIDKAIATHYLKKACKKLEESNVTVVAVTGSYGKTSVKDMLTALLDDAVSPNGSCNTPLGIAGFINKTDLYYAKYLILEFGARQRGDITELCNLYKPKFGIVTGVCAQHLSTFKNIDNVIAAKRELIEYLPPNGVCVLNDRDKIAESFACVGECGKIMSHDNLTVTVDKVDFSGTTLSVARGKLVKKVTLPQITEYVSDTFAMCLQTALVLKQSFTKTVSRAVFVKQTAHRMELIKTERCYLIDDGYNGSIAGIQSCVKTLSNFNCSKVVITQGLVECGKKRKEMNVECGRLLGSACDVAVVVGQNAKILSAGLSETACKVICAKNLQKAVALAQPYINGGILLFQNDIPDV